MIDISKLTPAPWIYYRSESHPDKWIINDANGEYVATLEIEEVARHVVLAANAFDVMMRRGWVEADRWYKENVEREPAQKSN